MLYVVVNTRETNRTMQHYVYPVTSNVPPETLTHGMVIGDVLEVILVGENSNDEHKIIGSYKSFIDTQMYAIDFLTEVDEETLRQLKGTTPWSAVNVVINPANQVYNYRPELDKSGNANGLYSMYLIDLTPYCTIEKEETDLTKLDEKLTAQFKKDLEEVEAKIQKYDLNNYFTRDETYDKKTIDEMMKYKISVNTAEQRYIKKWEVSAYVTNEALLDAMKPYLAAKLDKSTFDEWTKNILGVDENTKIDLSTLLTTAAADRKYARREDVEAKANLADVVATYATKEEVALKADIISVRGLVRHDELAAYYNKQEVDALLNTKLSRLDANAEFATKLELNTAIDSLNGLKDLNVDKIQELIDASEFTYTNDKQLPVTQGGLKAGMTFDHMPLKELLDKWLYPYQAPSFTTLTVPRVSYKLGETFASPVRVTWDTKNQENIVANTVYFTLANIDGVTSIRLNNTGKGPSGNESFSFDPIAKQEPAAITLRAIAQNTQGEMFSKEITIRWYRTVYYGNYDSETLNEGQAMTLASVETDSVTGSRLSFAANGYKWLLIPATWSSPTKYFDVATQFEVPMEQKDNVTITNAFGVVQEYKAFRSVNRLGGSINILIQ